MNNFQNIAVVIDADNTQYSKLPAVLREISTHGRIAVKRAYGNWKKDLLGPWENVIKNNAIHAMQQYDYVTGKNATDIALVIDTMDLLNSGIYDAFAIVSSDSDFTSLAIRLREAGIYIMGIGKESTAESFKKSCDDFIVLENLSNEIQMQKTEHSSTNSRAAAQKEDPIEELHLMLQDAYDIYKDESDYVNVAAVGSYIKRIKPDFDSRTYGCKKLSDLIAEFPDRYQVRTNANGFYYKDITASKEEDDDIQSVHALLKTAYELYCDETGFAHIGPTGSYLKKNLPHFDCMKHGYKNIPDLLSRFPQLYEIRKDGSSVLYRCIR